MEKAIDVIFGVTVLTATQFSNVATRKATKMFLNSFNNVYIEKVAKISAFITREQIETYSVPGTTAYVVRGSRFAVEGIAREGGFNVLSGGLGGGGDQWLVVRAKGLRIA